MSSRSIGSHLAWTPLVELSEQQQVVDQLLHPKVLLVHDLGEVADGRGVRMCDRDLAVLADRRHRRAKLVRGVGDEASLSGLR